MNAWPGREDVKFCFFICLFDPVVCSSNFPSFLSIMNGLIRIGPSIIPIPSLTQTYCDDLEETPSPSACPSYVEPKAQPQSDLSVFLYFSNTLKPSTHFIKEVCISQNRMCHLSSSFLFSLSFSWSNSL